MVTHRWLQTKVSLVPFEERAAVQPVPLSLIYNPPDEPPILTGTLCPVVQCVDRALCHTVL